MNDIIEDELPPIQIQKWYDEVIMPFYNDLKEAFPLHKIRIRNGDMGYLIDIDSQTPWYLLWYSRHIGKIRVILPYRYQLSYDRVAYPLIQLKETLPDTKEILEWIKKRLDKDFKKIFVEWEYKREKSDI